LPFSATSHDTDRKYTGTRFRWGWAGPSGALQFAAAGVTLALHARQAETYSLRAIRRPRGVTRTYLFGAGASVDAGVPATIELSKKIYESFYPRTPVRRALDVAMGGLRQRQSVVNGDAYLEPDVEDLYATLLRLAQRDSDPLAPFVSLWSGAVTGAEAPDPRWDARQVADGLKRDLAASEIRGQHFRTRDLGSFAAALSDALRPERSGWYDRAAEEVLSGILQSCVVEDDAKVGYLRRWLGSHGQEGVWIASLNYDNCIELAASAEQREVDRGVSDEGNVRVNPEVASGTVTLAKLHGSIDWKVRPDGRIVVGKPTPFTQTEPGIVLGSGTKLRVRGPYLDLLFSFRDRLARTDELHVCGYSFRDEHINHFLGAWWADGERTAVVHDPGNLYHDARGAFGVQPGAPEPRLRFDARTASAWMNAPTEDAEVRP